MSNIDYKPNACPYCKGRAFRFSKRYGWVCENPDCGFCTSPDDPLLDDTCEDRLTCSACHSELEIQEISRFTADGRWECPECKAKNPWPAE